ncbi:UNVERIFIED_CONTAM: hypothetical protein FKN15_027945 [Acipenser sinensis]
MLGVGNRALAFYWERLTSRTQVAERTSFDSRPSKIESVMSQVIPNQVLQVGQTICLSSKEDVVPLGRSCPSVSPTCCSYSTDRWVSQPMKISSQQSGTSTQNSGHYQICDKRGDPDFLTHCVLSGSAGYSAKSQGTQVFSASGQHREEEGSAERDEENPLSPTLDVSIDNLNQLILELDPSFQPIPVRTANHFNSRESSSMRSERPAQDDKLDYRKCHVLQYLIEVPSPRHLIPGSDTDWDKGGLSGLEWNEERSTACHLYSTYFLAGSHDDVKISEVHLVSRSTSASRSSDRSITSSASYGVPIPPRSPRDNSCSTSGSLIFSSSPSRASTLPPQSFSRRGGSDSPTTQCSTWEHTPHSSCSTLPHSPGSDTWPKSLHIHGQRMSGASLLSTSPGSDTSYILGSVHSLMSEDADSPERKLFGSSGSDWNLSSPYSNSPDLQKTYFSDQNLEVSNSQSQHPSSIHSFKGQNPLSRAYLRGHPSSCPPSVTCSMADIPVVLINGSPEHKDSVIPDSRNSHNSGTLGHRATMKRSCKASSTPAVNGQSSDVQPTMKFVMDTSKFWFKPHISRDQADALLKDQEPGSFIVRDSTSYRGAFGLAMKVDKDPLPSSRSDGQSSDLIRQYLIESSAKGVRLKGASEEPYFGSHDDVKISEVHLVSRSTSASRSSDRSITSSASYGVPIPPRSPRDNSCSTSGSLIFSSSPSRASTLPSQPCSRRGGSDSPATQCSTWEHTPHSSCSTLPHSPGSDTWPKSLHIHGQRMSGASLLSTSPGSDTSYILGSVHSLMSEDADSPERKLFGSSGSDWNLSSPYSNSPDLQKTYFSDQNLEVSNSQSQHPSSIHSFKGQNPLSRAYLRGHPSSCPPSVTCSMADIPVVLINGSPEHKDSVIPDSRNSHNSGTLGHRATMKKSCKASSTPAVNGQSSDVQPTMKFVMDTSKFWFKPHISRDQADALLKDQEPGSFIVRDSTSYRGAFGLAMKVDKDPLPSSRSDGQSSDLIRQYLIESSAKGVRLKGASEEPYFGSLSALVYQHAITKLALPRKLLMPTTACNLLFLNSVNTESLTGPLAVQKAVSATFETDPLPVPTIVNFKVSHKGIILTDIQRKLFFRRHYPANTLSYCGADPEDRKWQKHCRSARIFGFVAKCQDISQENVCHLFAEYDSLQPAELAIKLARGLLKDLDTQ